MKGSAGGFLRGGSTPAAPPGGRAGAGLAAWWAASAASKFVPGSFFKGGACKFYQPN
jgi:hypothetical protein